VKGSRHGTEQVDDFNLRRSSSIRRSSSNNGVVHRARAMCLCLFGLGCESDRGWQVGPTRRSVPVADCSRVETYQASSLLASPQVQIQPRRAAAAAAAPQVPGNAAEPPLPRSRPHRLLPSLRVSSCFGDANQFSRPRTGRTKVRFCTCAANGYHRRFL
jgi:hypothetical protein